MEPFYFGQEPRQLFGVYHPPDGALVRRVGVVLCYPVGQEYIRAHRAFLQLAQLLAGRGFSILRFDYYGCGDSLGDCDQGTPSQWIADISTAVDELRNTGVEQTVLIGLRWGAALALACGAQRGDVAAVVSWQPVVNGAAYLRELREAHRVWLAGSFAKPNRGASQGNSDEVLGFPIPPSAASEYDTFDLRALTRWPAPRVLLLENHSGVQSHDLAEHLESLDVAVTSVCIPYPALWEKGDRPETKGVVPVQALDFLGAWMAEAFP